MKGMSIGAQGLLLTFLGGVLVKTSLTDAVLLYVQPWMRWPLFATGILILVLSVLHIVEDWRGDREEEGHRAGLSVWFLLVPSLLVLVVNPPALGAAFVEQRGGNPDPPAQVAPAYAPLPAGDPLPMTVSQFVTLHQSAPTEIMDGRRIALTGFVTARGDDWYVARISIACCAADGTAYEVRMTGAEAPPTDTWVEVVGTWEVPTEAAPRRSAPTLMVERLREVPTPEIVYE
ncbi:TIGR03943 family protein [Alteromonas gracilis]